jgi:hypothetical protein
MFAQQSVDLNVSLVGCLADENISLSQCVSPDSPSILCKCSSVSSMLGVFVNILQVFKDNLFWLVNFTECHDVSYNDLLIAHGKLLCSLTNNHTDCGCCMYNKFVSVPVSHEPIH